MVKIVNGEIVQDSDPRAQTLPLSHPPSPSPYQSYLLHAAEQPSYPSPYGYPPPYHPYYSQYAAYSQPNSQYPAGYGHHSPFGYEESPSPSHDSSFAPPSHFPQPSPAPPSSHLSAPVPSSALTAPSPIPLSSRRLSFSSSSSSSLPPTSSPSLSQRRLSFSSSSHVPPPSHPSPPSSLYPRRSPSSYNLFGLPSLTISDIPVKPHVYLLAGLLLYFIGPPVLVPLLASFFFYRWHLNKEAERKERERLQAKFSVFRDAKTRPAAQQKTIHSLSDIRRGGG